VIQPNTRRGLLLAGGVGLGVGLMIGAAVLAASPKPGLTDAEAIARARQLGMINPTELPPSPPAAQTSQTPQAQTQPKTMVLLVPPGTDFGAAADALQEAGIVKDKEAFLARVKEREVAAKLVIGAHELPAAGATADQIIDSLISAH
jgi:hypothetical protein